MSEYTKLLENTEKLQELGFKTEFDIDPYLLSEDEVAKKILMSKNPNMKTEDVDMIIDSEETSIEKMEKEFKKEESAENAADRNLSREEKSQRKKEREEKREIRKKQIKQTKSLYKDKVGEIKDVAKQMLKQIKIAFYNLSRQVKDLVKKALTSSVQASSSIAAIALIIALPPWNIPLAISYTVTIVDLLLTLISLLKGIMPVTESFDKLRFVTNGKNLSILSKMINGSFKIVIDLWSKITALDDLIKLLLEKITGLLSGDNKLSVFRKATRRLRKLGHFRGNNQTYNIDGVDLRADSEDDASEVKDLLDTFRVDYGINKVVDYRNDSPSSPGNPEDFLSKLKDEVGKNQVVTAPLNVQESSYYIYDVKLPNGSVLRDQTESDLEELKRIYTVVVDQVQDITNSI